MDVQKYRDDGPLAISSTLHLEGLKNKSVIITGGRIMIPARLPSITY